MSTLSRTRAALLLVVLVSAVAASHASAQDEQEGDPTAGRPPADAQPGPPPGDAEPASAITEPPRRDAHAISAGDPVSGAPIPGIAPELAVPFVDVAAANLSASQNGTRITAATSPFFFLREYVPVISETALQLRADTGTSSWGFTLSSGYSTVRDRLWAADLDDDCYERALEPLRVRLGVPARGDAGRPETRVEYGTRIGDAILALADGPDKTAMQEAFEAAADAYGICDERRWRDFSVQEAHSGTFVVLASFLADFGAFLGGDEPTPDPTLEPILAVGGSASVGFFPVRDFAVWVTGSFVERRPDVSIAAFGDRLGVSVQFVGNIPIDRPTAEGFQPGVALGVIGAYTACVEAQACFESLKPSFSSPVQIESQLTVTPFVDLRFDAKLQLRIAAVIDRFDLLAPAIMPAPSDPQLWRVVPTLSLTTSLWSL